MSTRQSDMVRTLVKKLRSVLLILKHTLKTKHLTIPLSCTVTPSSAFGGYNSFGPYTILDGSFGICTYAGSHCELKSVSVGSFCSIASDVKILRMTHPTSRFVSTSPAFFSVKGQCGGKTFTDRNTFGEQLFVNGSDRYSCIIGSDVWVGENVTIIGGVEIGDGAVIGAGAVVTKNVPPYAVVGGVPAKILRYRFSEKDIGFLEAVRWWEWDLTKIGQYADCFDDLERFRERMTANGDTGCLPTVQPKKEISDTRSVGL